MKLLKRGGKVMDNYITAIQSSIAVAEGVIRNFSKYKKVVVPVIGGIIFAWIVYKAMDNSEKGYQEYKEG